MAIFTLSSALSLFITLFTLASSVQALNSTTYIYSEESYNFTFTLTAAKDTGDLFFRLTSPSGYDWVSVGIGKDHSSALMFIAYPGANESKVTWSPRISTRNSEPSYNAAIISNLINDPALPNSANPDQDAPFVVSAVCRNCTNWINPSLDLTSTSQPFMWAVGPYHFDMKLLTDSPSAPLRVHSLYQKFTMDMTKATVDSNPNDQLPILGTVINGAQANGDVQESMSITRRTPAHGALAAFGLVICIPVMFLLTSCCTGSICFYICTIVWFAFAFSGFVLGFLQSPVYNRSKNYNSSHQIIGIIGFIFMMLMIPLNVFARKESKKGNKIPDSPTNAGITPTQSRRSKLKNQPISVISLVVTALTVLFAVIDTGLGFDLALASDHNKFWAPAVVAFFIVFSIGLGARYMLRKKRQDLDDELTDLQQRDHEADLRQAQQQAYQMQVFKQQGGAPINEAPPPAYDAAPDGYYGNVIQQVQVPASHAR